MKCVVKGRHILMGTAYLRTITIKQVSFSYDFMAAMLLDQHKAMVALSVDQNSPWGIKF